MNLHLGSNTLCTLRAASRRTTPVLSQHPHTISAALTTRPQGRSVSTALLPFPRTRRSYPPPAVRRAETGTTRNHTTQATSPFGADDRPFDHRQAFDAGGKTVPRVEQTSTPYVKKSVSGRHRDGSDDGGGGIIVTTNKHIMRDKQGRPWTASSDALTSSQGRSRGAGAHEVGTGVGVAVSPSAIRKRKPRIELRDLSAKPKQRKLEPWQSQKAALDSKFGEEGWNPRKKLSPDAMEGIRGLHEENPERWATPVLAEHFKVSAESIRRILKSKWKPKDDEAVQKRKERWARRHDRIWDHQAELGLRPPREKDREVEDPDAFDDELRAKEVLNNARRA